MANSLVVCFMFLHLGFLFISFCGVIPGSWSSTSLGTVAAAPGNDTDRLALLSFKSGIVRDPAGALASWNASLHHCRWAGVFCGGPRHPTRVVRLGLSNRGLVGSISPSLANLTFLRGLLFRNNSLYGTITEDIDRLRRLEVLELSRNLLGGVIPRNLSSCRRLGFINLAINQLITGKIPPELGSLQQLWSLDLMSNQLHGPIPPSLGNLSSDAFTRLNLYENRLRGPIPESIGRLRGLKLLDVGDNQLSGAFPAGIYNMSSLRYLGLRINRLSGSLPPDLGLSLPLLRVLIMYENHFHGKLPSSLTNCSDLVILDVGGNEFQGKVPANLGRLSSLQIVNIYATQLQARDPADWGFLVSLANCTILEILGLGDNLFEGVLPSGVLGNLSTALTTLGLQGNQISSNIPADIENLVSLRSLDMGRNNFTGVIPPSLGTLNNLGGLSLTGNKLTGEIPSDLGNLSQLTQLYLDRNLLSGSIPASFGRLQRLQLMSLSSNKLAGTIPRVIFALSGLSNYMDLSSNSLEGPIPDNVGRMKSLGELYLSSNRLSGQIPSSLGDCESLQRIALDHNFFRGSIPASLGNLKALQLLDLSANNLSGTIPSILGNLAVLSHLNLSLNNLDGEVPKDGVFANASAVSLAGNGGLCGGAPSLRLPSCPVENHGRRRHSSRNLVIAVVTSCVVGAVVLLSCSVAYVLHSKKRSGTRPRPRNEASWQDKFERISYDELLRATGGFSPANLVGKGSFGSVYKGSLDGDVHRTIAVKVLDLQHRGAVKSFAAECEALRSIRHRNLVKIISVCATVDSKGDDFKALVYEFMPNGDLDQWLHGEQGAALDVSRRLSIAIDVASALEYLHGHSPWPVVHCDLKPSNVLLDGDMNPHLGDFGLARILCDPQVSASSVGLKGSIGYVAPEYGFGARASTHADVYSFGILLMEMFTGKRPVDDMFKEGLSLRRLVETAVSDHQQLTGVVDPRLLPREDDGVRVLLSVMEIGLMCTKDSPTERTGMGDVVKQLHNIRGISGGTEKRSVVHEFK